MEPPYMRSSTFALALVLCAAIGCGGGGDGGSGTTNPPPPAAVSRVSLITSGGMVNFTWSGVTHNVTFVNPPGSVASITDRSSGTVPVTFNTTGTYNYHCTIHPGMDGVVTVHIP